MNATADTPVLRLKGVNKRFGGVVAANDVDLDLPPGIITTLVGPNGAGKTTLFNLLTGAVRPDSGAVTLFGEGVTGRRIDQIAGLGLVRTFQEVRLFPALTVYENVLLGAARPRTAALWRTILAPRPVHAETEDALDRAAAALRLVSMEHKAMETASALSFGEQKLVALARAVASDAKVLLLDEPAAGVGTDIARQILDLIAGLGRQGVTVLLVEHNLEVVREVATSVYYLEAGSIRAHGTYEELTSDPELTASYFGTVADAPIEAGAAPVVGAGEGGAR
jgi:branched-chain amino acid transport system permease protein